MRNVLAHYHKYHISPDNTRRSLSLLSVYKVWPRPILALIFTHWSEVRNLPSPVLLSLIQSHRIHISLNNEYTNTIVGSKYFCPMRGWNVT